MYFKTKWQVPEKCKVKYGHICRENWKDLDVQALAVTPEIKLKILTYQQEVLIIFLFQFVPVGLLDIPLVFNTISSLLFSGEVELDKTCLLEDVSLILNLTRIEAMPLAVIFISVVVEDLMFPKASDICSSLLFL